MSETVVAPTVTPDELETWPTIEPEDPHKEGVAREAARLDRIHPDWYTRINISELRMFSCTYCILGQAYAPLDFGLAYDRVRHDAKNRDEEIWAPAYGAGECKPYWINEIMARRA